MDKDILLKVKKKILIKNKFKKECLDVYASTKRKGLVLGWKPYKKIFHPKKQISNTASLKKIEEFADLCAHIHANKILLGEK